MTEEALQRLLIYDWPGNVRELEHTVERAVVLARGGVITADNLAMEADREIAIVDLNQQLTDGKTLDIKELANLGTFYREFVRQHRPGSELKRPAWDRPWILGLFFAWFVVTWWTRRRWGAI